MSRAARAAFGALRGDLHEQDCLRAFGWRSVSACRLGGRCSGSGLGVHDTEPGCSGAASARRCACRTCRRPEIPAGVPQIVAAGKGAEVRACNTCHTPSGMGQPESANIRGLNAVYFERQMADFKSGARGGPRSGAMVGFAKNLSEAEVKEIAEYYQGLKPSFWTKISEAKETPKTLVLRTGQRTMAKDGGMEDLGNRIIEVAANPALVRQMEVPAFTAYVPEGSVTKGMEIVTTGGGKTTSCRACHGDDLHGQVDIPSIAGHSPVYIARQLYSFKNGVRKGPNADIMKGVVGNLSDEDIVAIAAFVASRDAS
jgi:cytochrome c553